MPHVVKGALKWALSCVFNDIYILYKPSGIKISNLYQGQQECSCLMTHSLLEISHFGDDST